VMRFLFIFAGIALIERFHWVIYIFGAFLVFIGIKMTMYKDKELHPENNIILRIFKKLMPVTDKYEGDKFISRIEGRRFATPLFVVLLVVETTDIVFAVDSIPAIFAITLDPFIVFTSNIFAILGLRALYFALSGVMQKFKYLTYGLSIILVFIGIKMLLASLYKIPIGITLGFILIVLLGTMLWSMISSRKEEEYTLSKKR
ncbi:MAG: TerC/Alx family metal homeostasis membrane protein, partial [Candidatus Firestonebacteria bacterium]